MLRDGSLEIKGNNVPSLNQGEVQQILAELEQQFVLDAFSKPDFFAST
jgi:hypothetical protein